jgi:hypothetical protein
VDRKTAYYFDRAIRIKESWGELASVKFLQERKILIKVGLRVVSTIFKKRRVKFHSIV